MSSDAREDPVGQADHGVLGGHEAPTLSKQDDDRCLAQVGRLARHVRAGEDDDLRAVRIEVQIVGDEHAGGQSALDQWVAAALDRELQACVDLWASPRVLGCSDCNDLNSAIRLNRLADGGR